MPKYTTSNGTVVVTSEENAARISGLTPADKKPAKKAAAPKPEKKEE